jgi:hypothetical protein
LYVPLILGRDVISGRVLTGGSSEKSNTDTEASGEAAQKLLGVNETEGVNLRFEMRVITPQS